MDSIAGFVADRLAVVTNRSNASMVYMSHFTSGKLKLDQNSDYYDAGGSGTFPGYGSGFDVYQVVYRYYCIDHSDPDRPVLRRKDHPHQASGPDDLTCSGGDPLADYIEDLQITPTTADNNVYTVTVTARTAKPLMRAGGVAKRKSITQRVSVRNLQ